MGKMENMEKMKMFFGSPTDMFSNSIYSIYTLDLRHTRLENMILGQLRIGERQMTSAALGTLNIGTFEH